MINKPYDVAIIGGGLAGLTLSILQVKAGKSVVLFEKNSYPMHRVCGEYISLESWNLLINLGLDLDSWQLPIIKKLQVSSPSGKILNSELELGGFGISRYKLDFELANLAKSLGVVIHENTAINKIESKNNFQELSSSNASYLSLNVVGSFGKRSNIDVSWNRDFILKNRSSLNQYIGVKYHIKLDMDKDIIALHNFKNGYCGISAIEDGVYCLCYLTTKENLKNSDNSIALMEKNILRKNPFLDQIFTNATFLWSKPEVISQVSFETKEIEFNSVPLIGDAAGLIAPLCGNGMSMAFKGAVLMHQKLENKFVSESVFIKTWHQAFKSRLWVGKTIQRFFGNEFTTNMMINFFKLNPRLLRFLISKTHGKNIEV